MNAIKTKDELDCSIYMAYISRGFKAVGCKGYLDEYNSQKDYKTAKQPVVKGYTDDSYKGMTFEEACKWAKDGGWVGWVLPKNTITIDTENQDAASYIDNLCSGLDIKPSIQKTSNGYHYIFIADKEYTSNSKVLTKGGIEVTYRPGGKTQLILPPIEDRRWIEFKQMNELPLIPEELRPYERDNRLNVLKVLSWEIGEEYKKDVLEGYADIDAAYMALLVECKFTLEETHKAFSLVFRDKYDYDTTNNMYERTKERYDAKDNLIGAGTLIRRVEDLGLHKIKEHINKLKALSGVSNSIETEDIDFNPDDILWSGLDIIEKSGSIEYCVDKLIPKESITLIAGEGGIGKTWLGIQLANALSNGKTFLGFDTNQMPVIYIDYENSLPVLKARVQLIGRDTKAKFWHHKCKITPPKIDSKEYKHYKKLPKNCLIVIDTLRASHSKNENDSKEMSEVMSRLKELRDEGHTVVVLHHTSKADKKGYKGSSVILDQSDHVLNFYKETNKNTLSLHTRDKTRYEPIHIHVKLDPSKGLVNAEDPAEDKLRIIFKFIKDKKKKVNQSEIFEYAKTELGIKGKNDITALLKKGEDTKWNSKKEGRYRYYSLKNE